MNLKDSVRRLRAIAEPTRLRLLALLVAGEISVGELSAVLEQSQPRVSRHLKLLVEAGLVSRFRDRHWVYYRLAEGTAARDLVHQTLALADSDDAALSKDRLVMEQVKQGRERSAYTSLGTSPALWPADVGARPAEPQLAEALEDALADVRVGDLLDIGSGTGVLLRLLAPQASSAVGIDTSKEMRLLARARLQRAGLADCTVRNADLHMLPFASASFDTVVLNEVLSLSGDRVSLLQEAIRVLRSAGRLLILDNISPVVRRLTDVTTPAGLSENQLQAILLEQGLRVVHRAWFPGPSMQRALFSALRTQSLSRTGTDA